MPTDIENAISPERLAEILPDAIANIDDFLGSTLLGPLNDLLQRPRKNFRGQLVELGFRFSGGDPESRICRGIADVMELLHSGSLVIDDIEDGSPSRRGLPSLHTRYGVPIALNAGNWLYFWPLEVIRRLDLAPELEMALYRQYHRTMVRAHIGQALDVGVAVDSLPVEKLEGICLASLELKSGTLTALALAMGAIAGGAASADVQRLEDFGMRFGIALQMFDDLGNVTGPKEPAKYREDLRLRRPSWIWACAAVLGNYESFRTAVAALPDPAPLDDWFRARPEFLIECRDRARAYLETSLDDLERAFPPTSHLISWVAEIRDLALRLTSEY